MVRRVGPRDALERSVRSIWAEVLGHRDFGVHESFFALGGDSFGMVRVQARLSTAFGYEIPLGALFSAMSVAGTAVLLRGSATASPTPLVRFAPRDRGRPVFCFHPLGGSAAVYYPLAVALTSNPCYGLQALGLTLGHPPQRSLAKMVRTYVDAMAEAVPAGVVPHLLGYSLGGRLAFSAAQEMRRRYQITPVVFMLGTATGNRVDETEPYKAIGAYAMHLSLDYDALAAMGRDAALMAVYDAALRAGVFGPDFPIDRLASIFDTAFANLQAALEAPLTHYDGEVVLVRSAGAPEGTDWAPYVQRVTTYEVPFPHALMLEEKAARRIAALLGPHLAR
jgi:thioesterase domain-containing protein